MQKPQTQRSMAVMRSNVSPMKKKESYGLFDSEIADSVVDELDLESIIQSKMIDKTGKGKKTRS